MRHGDKARYLPNLLSRVMRVVAVWNSLPDHLRDPAVDSKQFRRDLKTYLFAGHSKH